MKFDLLMVHGEKYLDLCRYHRIMWQVGGYAGSQVCSVGPLRFIFLNMVLHLHPVRTVILVKYYMYYYSVSYFVGIIFCSL